MIINAVIESKDGGTLVLDFPRSIYDVYEKLQSVGIRQSPHQITLSDEEGDDVRVKLYSEDETGKHLLLTLKEQNSLADANIKHLLHLPLRAEVLPPHPPAAFPNLLRERTPCHDCHAGNRRQA